MAESDVVYARRFHEGDDFPNPRGTLANPRSGERHGSWGRYQTELHDAAISLVAKKG